MKKIPAKEKKTKQNRTKQSKTQMAYIRCFFQQEPVGISNLGLCFQK